MLVIISDLHLTDGTTGKTVAADAFRMFREHVRNLAYDASWRSDGTYRPVTAIDIVLLGDIFDLIRSTHWSDEARGSANFARPWDDPVAQPALARKVAQISDGILRQNEASFRLLRELSASDPITLPPADGRGLPARGSQERQSVTTRLHYLVGNHDWFLHLPGSPFERIREQITAALGLANPPGPFPHDPAESEALTRVFADHKVFARHGDIYDSFNYDADRGRDAATLGDAIVVEIINRFPQEVRRQMGDELPAYFLDSLYELANVRPSLLVPVWIAGQINRAGLGTAQGNEVKRVWNDIADEALALPFIREQDTRSPFDAVDLLETTLHFSRVLSFHSIAEIVSLVKKKLWGGDSSFARHALTETAFQNRSAHYFVYGHTHHYEVVPLDVVAADGGVLEQLYFNSGTWHPVHETAVRDPRRASFIQFKVLTHIAFFKDDERKGRRFETWTGSLDD